jgi:DNA-binding MarR family transcriptional regulator
LARTPPSGSSLAREIRQRRPFRSTSEEATVGLLFTAEKLRRRLTEAVEAERITLQQYNVLRILRGAHPDTLPTLEIAARMLEHTPGITRLLDRLEAKRLVGRDRGRDDRRRVHVRITSQGLELLARLDAPMLAAAADGFRGLGPRETAELSRLLDRVRQGLGARSRSTRSSADTTQEGEEDG